jgi:2-oxoglutarate dehydrogenase E2 component (dihydrolipoamide succinyltransferase)
VVELETDKVTVEVNAPASGVLGEINAPEGTTVAVGALLGAISNGAGLVAAKPAQPSPAAAPQASVAQAAPPPAPKKASPPPSPAPAEKGNGEMPPSPAARKKLAEAGLDAAAVVGSGKRGQILKDDVPAAPPRPAGAAPAAQPDEEPAATAPAAPALARGAPVPVPMQSLRLPPAAVDAAREERVRMTKLRQTIAKRLKDAQNTAAMLTTFNDVDMSAVMKLRSEFKDLFEKRHGVKLGFMGFFVKACLQALKEIPAVNAEIDGDEIVYKNYYHIGVAVSTDRGLVVPVVREADRMSLAEIEAQIADFGKRAREGKLDIADMQGGTFTITNGGVFGSLLSTPILNAPQSGILGMHRIEERPVVRDGQVVARPMMYLALSYDHRIVDGNEAVAFLVRVKECLEEPQRFILEL